jgi:predicted alpha/beta-fold hydrolase
LRAPAWFVMTQFRPAWWCRNRHAQTMWGPLFRRIRLSLRRERVVLPDGDFVDLDWVDGAPAGAPLVLVLHGLEGSSQSHYVLGLLAGARERGWRGVALNFRSCSGELNRLPRFYHSGDTGDLDAIVRALVEREPALRLGIVGVSLGGNVVLKWLGEQGGDAPAVVKAAAGISVPFDLTPCARALDRGFAKWVYTANFMRTMRKKVVEKARVYPDFVDLGATRRARTFAAYDNTVTAPLSGFTDAEDYWRRASCRPYLARVARPALVVNAADDPFVPPSALPNPTEMSAHVRLVVTPRGGHVGFLEGRWPWRVDSWAEGRALDFLGTRV